MSKLNLTPGSIVVGVDGSDHALRAVELAAREAVLRGLPLDVVHVMRARDRRLLSFSENYGEVRGPDPDPAFGTTVSGAIAVARTRRPGLAVSGHEADGDPGRVLLEASDTAALLLVGSRGRGPVTSRLLGSVSANVSYHARCPVIVSRPKPPGVVPEGVVVAADLTPESETVVDFAFEQASLLELPLTVLHCTATPRPEETVAAVAVDERLRTLLHESVAGSADRHPDVHVTVQIIHGDLDEWLTDGNARPWELIVVGRHVDEHGVMRWLGGAHSTAVLESADCPVAVVPQAGARRRQVSATDAEHVA